MNIISYPREQIREELSRARSHHQSTNNDIRILFAPTRINHDNFDRACDIYSRLGSSNYDAIVVVEAFGKVLDKKLLMTSKTHFETPLGLVPGNDLLRNEFLDKGDNFHIHDEGFSKDTSLFQELMILQSACDDFSAVSIQITDKDPAIVKELADVLDEVLASRNALLVFCCDLDNARNKEFEKVKKMVQNKSQSGLMNYLNNGKSKIEGTTAFIAGVLVAYTWELDLNFLNGEYDDYEGSLLTAYADRQTVPL